MKSTLISLTVWIALAMLAAGSSVVTADNSRDQYDEQRVADLVNAARASGRYCGRNFYPAAQPLSASAVLSRAALHHARDMARNNFFDHIALDGSVPKQRVRREGYAPRLTGENIAFGPETAEEVVDGWLSSPGHCANIMDARFRDIGVAVAFGRRRGHIYWVQVFGWR
jgi:uncharacterized protein YkwD